MIETDLSHEIKKALTFQRLVDGFIKFDYMRLESHSTLQGLPDALMCVQRDWRSGELVYEEKRSSAQEIWLELKIGSETPNALQIGFARRRWELGQHNIYCIRGYQTLNKEVAAFVEPMSIYWSEYKPLPSMVMTMDRLAYFLLTGEKYRDK